MILNTNHNFSPTHRGLVGLRGAGVARVGLGKDGDVHRDGAVVIVDTADEEHPAEHHESETD